MKLSNNVKTLPLNCFVTERHDVDRYPTNHQINERGKMWTNTTVLNASALLVCSPNGLFLPGIGFRKRCLNISDFQGRSYLRQCVMLSHYGQCLLSLNLAMSLIMPELRLWRNFSDLPKLLLFYNLLKTVLFLSHWSCCWLDGFVNLLWLCLKQWCVWVCSFRRRFLVRVVFTVAIIPCKAVRPTLYSLPSKFMYTRPKGSIHAQ